MYEVTRFTDVPAEAQDAGQLLSGLPTGKVRHLDQGTGDGRTISRQDANMPASSPNKNPEKDAETAASSPSRPQFSHPSKLEGGDQ
jgi:hypothetical protein